MLRDGLESSTPVFPSPCGEKVGINNNSKRGSNNLWKTYVSVPLRGKGRDQLALYEALPVPLIYIVSVPLRGKGRDQQ